MHSVFMQILGSTRPTRTGSLQIKPALPTFAARVYQGGCCAGDGEPRAEQEAGGSCGRASKEPRCSKPRSGSGTETEVRFLCRVVGEQGPACFQLSSQLLLSVEELVWGSASPAELRCTPLPLDMANVYVHTASSRRRPSRSRARGNAPKLHITSC